jgi:hypothetical protein
LKVYGYTTKQLNEQKRTNERVFGVSGRGKEVAQGACPDES